jgi:hypothetical protein
LNERNPGDYPEQDCSNMYWKTSGRKESEGRISKREDYGMTEYIADFSFINQHETETMSKELPVTQLYHSVSSK